MISIIGPAQWEVPLAAGTRTTMGNGLLADLYIHTGVLYRTPRSTRQQYLADKENHYALAVGRCGSTTQDRIHCTVASIITAKAVTWWSTTRGGSRNRQKQRVLLKRRDTITSCLPPLPQCNQSRASLFSLPYIAYPVIARVHCVSKTKEQRLIVQPGKGTLMCV